MRTALLSYLVSTISLACCLSVQSEEANLQRTTAVFTLPGNFDALGLGEGLPAQTLLEKHGVIFPKGSSAQFLEAGNQLEVTNVEEELLISETVVSLWNRIGDAVLNEERHKQREQVERKLLETIIPHLKFEDTPLFEVLDWLEEASIEFDRTTNNEQEKGIVISREQLNGVFRKPLENESGFGFEPDNSLSKTKILETPLTIRLNQIPLIEALREVASLAQLQFSVTEQGVMLELYHEVERPIETVVYSIPPGFKKYLQSLLDAQESEISECFPDDPFQKKKDRSTIPNLTTHELLEWMGISFPVGASIQILKTRNLFIVKNTTDQIELIEALLEMADAEALAEWQTRQKALMESKLASIRLSDFSYSETSFSRVAAKLTREILRHDTHSKIWNRGITIDLKKAESKFWSDQWGREITIELENGPVIETLEKLAAELDWEFIIHSRGITFLTD